MGASAGLRAGGGRARRLRRQTGDLFLAPAGRIGISRTTTTRGAGRGGVRTALGAMRHTETSFPTGTPRAVWSQRATIAKLGGDDAAEREAVATARRRHLRNAEDYRLAGTERC